MPELITRQYKFLNIFQEFPDGSLSPKRIIEINGITFSPGVIFQKGVAFGGVDFHLFKYSDIEAIEQSDGILKITGFYR